MKNILFLMLSMAASFDLCAMENDPNGCDITGLDKVEVLDSLLKVARQGQAEWFKNLIDEKLTEQEMERVIQNNWNIRYPIKFCTLDIDLSQDKVDVFVFNWHHGWLAAQKAIEPLKTRMYEK